MKSAFQVIAWVKSFWKEVTCDKCGFPTDDYVATAQYSDKELFHETSENCSIYKYIEVDNTLATFKEVDVSKIDQRGKLQNECIKEVSNVEIANSDLHDDD